MGKQTPKPDPAKGLLAEIAAQNPAAAQVVVNAVKEQRKGDKK